jgi:hypothetical protein
VPAYIALRLDKRRSEAKEWHRGKNASGAAQVAAADTQAANAFTLTSVGVTLDGALLLLLTAVLDTPH